MKIGTRLAALGGVALVGALSLTACGSDNNSDSGNGGGGEAAASLGVTCEKGTVTASGSTAQANAMASWIKAYQQACSGATINYQGVGSGAGIQQFTAGSTGFAGSDSALKPEEHGPADQRCKTGKAIDLPMVTGPIAVVYNLPGVDGLQLSPKNLRGDLLRQDHQVERPRDRQGQPQDAKLPSTADPDVPPLRRVGHQRQLHEVPDGGIGRRLDLRARQEVDRPRRPGREGFGRHRPGRQADRRARSATTSTPTPPTASCRWPRCPTAPASSSS